MLASVVNNLLGTSGYGLLVPALPPVLYEILNCAIAATCFVALVICIRYLVTSYLFFRRPVDGMLGLGRIEALRETRKHKLAVGFTIFLLGETPRMTWVWLARYLENTGQGHSWMGQSPWILLPVAGSALAVLGMACIVRALVPEVWGRFGYWVAIGAAVIAVTASQVMR